MIWEENIKTYKKVFLQAHRLITIITKYENSYKNDLRRIDWNIKNNI